MSARRVLILAHPFPPAGGGGVQRTTKLVKYLPSFGWEPVVLTTQAELYPRRYGLEDRSLLAQIPPSVEVHRVPSPEILGDGRPLRRLASWTWMPDRARLWNRVAIVSALALAARRRFDVVYATGNPFSTFMLARAVAGLTKTPYVLDFRDNWMLRAVRRPLRPRLERESARLERLVLADAARVVFATQPMEETYLGAYPSLAGRASTVINGFDEEDFPEATRPGPEAGPSDLVRFLHAGTLNAYVNPEGLFHGLALARAASSELARRLRLRLIGELGSTPKEREELRASILRHGLSEVVELEGYRPHAEVVLLERTADVLVLVTSGLKEEQRAKTTEYLAAQRPILGLVVEGMAAERLLSYAGQVERARPDDPRAIARAIGVLFSQADARRPGASLPRPPPSLEVLTRRHGAQKMAEILGQAAELGGRLRLSVPRWRDL